MTIEWEEHITGVNAIKVFCNDCYNGNGRHWYNEHHGYGDTEPVTNEERRFALDAAMDHDIDMNGDHKVRIIIFKREE
jgi:hypothetical protein